MPSNLHDPKPRRPRSGAVREDGVSPTGARRAPADRLVDRPDKDASLETYEQQAPRETDDPRKGAEEGAANRTARDEP